MTFQSYFKNFAFMSISFFCPLFAFSSEVSNQENLLKASQITLKSQDIDFLSDQEQTDLQNPIDQTLNQEDSSEFSDDAYDHYHRLYLSLQPKKLNQSDTIFAKESPNITSLKKTKKRANSQ